MNKITLKEMAKKILQNVSTTQPQNNQEAFDKIATITTEIIVTLTELQNTIVDIQKEINDLKFQDFNF